MANVLLQQESYKRGMVLGLTMAEIVLLILFTLLLVLAALLTDKEREQSELQAEIVLIQKQAAWIPGRSATASSEADFHVFAKLSKDGLERGFEPEAFAGCEVGGEDDLLDVLI